MSKGLSGLLKDLIFTPEVTGKIGEKLTERELNLVQLFGRKGKILKNVYLPKVNGETSEVDVIYITRKGIFVFESKNYSGWIFGDEKGQYWTAMLPNQTKNRFYNPIKQNRTHMRWMTQFVGEDVPLFSIIVFSERCELKKVEVQSQDIKVINRDRVYATVRTFWDDNPDVVSEERINELYEQLKSLTNVDNAIKAAHIKDIEEKYKTEKPSISKAEVAAANEDVRNLSVSNENLQSNAETTAFTDNDESEVEPSVCPKCGGNLVLRTAKKGPNVGNQFWGCANFPKCRYVKNC